VTKDAIRTFVLSELPWEGRPEELRDDTSLLSSGALDSLGITKLVSFVEQEFGIELAPDEIVPENFETIAAVAQLVDEKRPAPPA
jgi:acyl carrier protein